MYLDGCPHATCTSTNTVYSVQCTVDVYTEVSVYNGCLYRASIQVYTGCMDLCSQRCIHPVFMFRMTNM